MASRREVLDAILAVHRRGSRFGRPLVGVSGIDGSGKSTLAAEWAAQLEEHGVRVALIGLDDWHNPPDVRFARNGVNAGRHFFQQGIRFPALIQQLLSPLRRHGSLELTTEVLQASDLVPRQKTFSFRDVGLILFEGIFLFRRELRPMFDLKIWVKCSFETALRRALLRKQEGLPEDEIRRDYHNIYFPAQKFHLQRDNPAAAADLILRNED
jgi:uridine kinase